VRLLVCTHAHADHYGLAAPVIRGAGCELWMHPNHAHMTKTAGDPDEGLERRLEVARQSGVPEADLMRFEAERREWSPGLADVVLPDRELVTGVEVQTDFGAWRVHETPGHAPSHVVLHQPERGLLLSGDHLLGRVSLYYDYGYTPDPTGEFLQSLDVVDRLDVQLVLAGHGRPVRDARALAAANRKAVGERVERVRRALADGPCTAFDIVPPMVDRELPRTMMVGWGLSETLCYLRHLELRGEVERLDGSDPERWARVG
jgi:glyoxylase-like metal-dependent hydrolase (beta-lactamase superfamily II)